MISIADLYVVDYVCDAPLSWHRVALGIEVNADGLWACTLWSEEDWGAHKHVVFRHAEVLLNYQKHLCIDDNGIIIKIVVDRDSEHMHGWKVFNPALFRRAYHDKR
jgi:hypothetical protein